MSESLSAYQCSSFGGTARAKLRAAEAKGCVKATGKTMRQKLNNSDIVFFGGHHYARPPFNDPLAFEGFDLKKVRLQASKVKLLLISSCAGLRKNARDRFKVKFPNAYIFGWIFASPLNQKGIWPSFIGSIEENYDLSRPDDMNKLIQKWKQFIENRVERDFSVRPQGLGYATPEGRVTYYSKKKGSVWEWKTQTSTESH